MCWIGHDLEEQFARCVEHARHDDLMFSRFSDQIGLCHVPAPFLVVQSVDCLSDQSWLPINGGRTPATYRSPPAAQGAVHTSAAVHPGAHAPTPPRGARAGASRSAADLALAERPARRQREGAHGANPEYVGALDQPTPQKLLSY